MSQMRPQKEQERTAGLPEPVTLEASAILNGVADAIFILDSSGQIHFKNHAARETFGLRTHDENIRYFLAEDEAARLEQKIKRLIDKDIASFHYYFRVIDKIGRDICFEAIGMRFENAGTAQPLAALTVREIEAGGHAIQFLASSYSRKTYWTWRNDFKTRMTSWPPEMCALTGISPEAGAHLTSHAVRELLHPRDRYVLRNVYQRSQEDHAPIVFHSRLRLANGGYVNCLTHGFIERDAAGNPLGFIGFSCDITKEVEADRMLRDNETQLRELVEEIADLVILRDGEGKLIYVSPASRRLLGYESATLIGTRVIDSVHPDDVPGYAETYKTLPIDGETLTLTFRYRHVDGRYIWLESKMRCLAATPDGRPARIASISRDVTERKEAEAALAAARERAEAASATKSRFLANMSHELRTPLNAIIGFSDIIHRELFGPAGNPQYKEYARLIQESGAHLLDLINDVLDMSKIEAGKFELRLEELDLEDMIHSCMTLMEPHAQKSKLKLAAKTGSRPGLVRADRRAVKQILLNLMTNAIKFTPAGGLVTVSVERMMDGVALQIADNGVGIPAEDIERITQPFEQVTSDPMLAQAGSGLGLALVQSLVGMHMGKLKIDSVPGQGTVVSVFLPIDPRSRRAA